MKKVSSLGIAPDENGIVWMEALLCPDVRLTGLPWKEKNKNYHRMDDEYFDQYPLGIQNRSNNTSGVQATVRTDSKTISARIVMEKPEFMEHMTHNGTCGFDVFKGDGEQKRFWNVGSNFGHFNEFSHTFGTDGQMTDYTFNLPLYAGVSSFFIGLSADANIDVPTPFNCDKPVCFYGSSITQGGCVSRPGNVYTNMLSRLLNVEIVSFGFSSNARGDMIMADRINDLDLAAFVYDYDHNAPNAEHLEQTHEPFFKRIREKHPDLPVIMMTKVDYDDDPVAGEARKAVIYRTYQNAVNAGDKNVYFIDGSKIFGDFLRDACTSDRNHPNDLGHARMAAAVYPVLKEILKLK